MQNRIETIFAGLKTNRGASEKAILAVEEALKIRLPSDYRQFLAFSNGYLGEFGKTHLELWKIGNLIKQNNGYNAPKFTPQLLLFGSNGGGSGYGFDYRIKNRNPVVKMELIELDFDFATRMGSNLIDFLTKQHMRSEGGPPQRGGSQQQQEAAP